MPAEFGDPSYPGLGTAGVQSQVYGEKMGFCEAKTRCSPINSNTSPTCDIKSLVATLGYMPAEFSDPSS